MEYELGLFETSQINKPIVFKDMVQDYQSQQAPKRANSSLDTSNERAAHLKQRF